MFFSSFKIITFSHLNYTNFKDSFKGNFMRVKMNKMVSKDKPLYIYKTTPKKTLGNNVEIRQNLIFNVSTSNRRQFGVLYLLRESSCKLKLKLEKITYPKVFTFNKTCNDSVVNGDIKYNRHKIIISFLKQWCYKINVLKDRDGIICLIFNPF